MIAPFPAMPDREVLCNQQRPAACSRALQELPELLPRCPLAAGVPAMAVQIASECGVMPKLMAFWKPVAEYM